MTTKEDLQKVFKERLQNTLEFEDDAFEALSKQIQEECKTNCKEGLFFEDCAKPMGESLKLMFKDGTKFAAMKTLDAVQFSCQNMVKMHSPQLYLDTCLESEDTSNPNENYDDQLCRTLSLKSAQVEALFKK